MKPLAHHPPAKQRALVTGSSGQVGVYLAAQNHLAVRGSPGHFGPTEPETPLGDAGKARQRLGRQPQIPFAELVREMLRADLAKCSFPSAARA